MGDNGVVGSKLEGIFVVDRAQRVIQWSGNAATLTGVLAKDALGLPCYEVMQGRDVLSRAVCGPQCPGFKALHRGQLTGYSSLLAQPNGGPSLPLECELTALRSPTTGAVGRLYPPEAGSPLLPRDTEPGETALQRRLTPSPDVVHDLSALATLTTTLSSSSSPGSLEVALDILREATGAEAAEVFLAEPGERGMVLTYFRGPFKHAFSQISRFKPGEGFPGLVLAHQEPILTRALPEDTRYLRTQVKEKGFHSYLCVPLYGPRSVMGSVNVAFRRPDIDPARSLALLTWASGPLSMRLRADVLHLRETMHPYQDGGNDPVGGMLREALLGMVGLSGAQGGAITLMHPGGNGLARRVKEGSFAAALCPNGQGDPSQSCPALHEVHGLALYGERRFWPVPCQRSLRLGNVTYCIPMVAGKEAIGLIQLAFPKPGPQPPTRDLALLEWVAEGVARQIRDAWQYLEGSQHTEKVLHQLRQVETAPLSQEGASSLHEPATAQSEDGRTVAPHLDIRCFGPFELYRQGSLITPDMVQRRKALTLLKILLTYDGRPVPKDTLIELLWPEVEPDAGASRLYVLVHALRRLVEPSAHGGKWSFIQNEGDRYWFNLKASCRIDVKEFKALISIGKTMETKDDAKGAFSVYEAARQLYKGDYLEDEPFAEWCWAEKEQLRETCLDAVRRLAALCAKAGDYDQGVKYLRNALRIDPSREELHRELMRCLWANGRRDEALRQYEACRDLLQHELGVDPLPETEQLAQRIRSSPGP